MTMTFSTFSLPHLDLPPVHPTPTAPNAFSLFDVHNAVQVPSPTYPNPSSFRFCASPPHPNPSSFRSWASPRLFLRLKDGSTMRPISRRNCISLGSSRTTSVAYVLDVRRWVRCCLPRFNIRFPRRVRLETQWLPVGVPGQVRRPDLSFSPSTFQEFPSHSPPNSSHSVSLLCHSPLHSAKPSARTALCQCYPAPPISRLTLVSSTSSSVTTSSSPRHLFSLFPTFPSSSYSPSYVPYTLSRRPPPRSCMTAECVQDDRASVFPLSLYEVEDFDVYWPGVDLKTDIANGGL